MSSKPTLNIQADTATAFHIGTQKSVVHFSDRKQNYAFHVTLEQAQEIIKGLQENLKQVQEQLQAKV